IRAMAREAWIAYTRLAWGHEALRPVTGEPYDDSTPSTWWSATNKSGEISGGGGGGGGAISPSGRTIVSAASSLWLMGLRHEYEQARNWIATQFPSLASKSQSPFGPSKAKAKAKETAELSKLGLYFS